jgi:hypothetical protein
VGVRWWFKGGGGGLGGGGWGDGAWGMGMRCEILVGVEI